MEDRQLDRLHEDGSSILTKRNLQLVFGAIVGQPRGAQLARVAEHTTHNLLERLARSELKHIYQRDPQARKPASTQLAFR